MEQLGPEKHHDCSIGMKLVICELVQKTAKSYGQMLGRLRPCRPGNEFLEQNLVTIFSHIFLKQFDDGIAFSEVPFLNADSGKWSWRLDGYLATAEMEILLEAKGSQPKTDLFHCMSLDLARLQSPSLQRSIDFMASGTPQDARNYKRPSKRYNLVLGDCWSEKAAGTWEGRAPILDRRGKHLNNLDRLERKSFFVREFETYKYYLIAGWAVASSAHE